MLDQMGVVEARIVKGDFSHSIDWFCADSGFFK